MTTNRDSTPTHPLTPLSDPDEFQPRFHGLVVRPEFGLAADALLAQAPAALVVVLGVGPDDAQGWLDTASEMAREEFTEWDPSQGEWDEPAVTWRCLAFALDEELGDDVSAAFALEAASRACSHAARTADQP